MEVIKYKRGVNNYSVLKDIFDFGPKGVTVALADNARTLVETEMREMRKRDPKLDGFTAFQRVAELYPAAVCIVMTGMTEGHVPPEVVENEYTEEA